MLSRNLQRFRLITFDCTNTLLYFKRPPSDQYLATAIALGHKKEDFDSNVDMLASFRKHFKELHSKHANFGKKDIGYQNWWTELVTNVLMDASGHQKKAEDFEEVAETLIHQYETAECWNKFEFSNELLTALKHDGKILGVISNFDPRLSVLLMNMDLFFKFDFVLTSYDANVEKPDLKIFAQALDQALAIDWSLVMPHEALHIGNEIDKDFEGAREAGWSSVLINSSEKNVEPSFKDIASFYRALNNENLNL